MEAWTTRILSMASIKNSMRAFFVFLFSSNMPMDLVAQIPSTVETVALIQSNQPTSARIRMDPVFGTVKTISQMRHATTHREGRQHSDIALDVFRAYPGLLGTTRPEEHLVYVLQTDTGMGRLAVRFDQYHNGIPVLNSGYVVGIASTAEGALDDGDIFYLSGRYVPIEAGSVQPRIDAGSLREMLGSSETQTGDVELVYYPLQDLGGHPAVPLAYLLSVRDSKSRLSYMYAIDAITGKILDKVSASVDVAGIVTPSETEPPTRHCQSTLSWRWNDGECIGRGLCPLDREAA